MNGLIDWGIAGRIADLAATGDSPDPGDGEALEAAVDEARGAVEHYTGLESTEGVPDPEWVSRRQWAQINLDSLRQAIAPLEERLLSGPSLPGPISGGLNAVLGSLAGAQVGALVGYASRRVLGQYEFPVLGPERRPRLLFVAPNLEEARRELGGEPETVLRWIALHEVTHAVHFGAAPWLRDHLRWLANELLSGSRLALGPSEVAELAKRAAGTDPRRWLGELWSSDPITLLAPPESRALINRTQATMASVEGYAEHVMDAAAPQLGEEIGDLRFALERRREDRAPLARLLGWLLGMELKMRQYRDGKRFCDSVVELAGIEALNGAWADAESLPTLAELADPGSWLERTAAGAQVPV